MEKALLDSDHGLATLLAGLIVILALHLIMKIIQMGLDAFNKKAETTDRLSSEFKDVSARLMAIERDMNEVLKFRKDFRNMFTALKLVAGEKWPDIRAAIEEDSIKFGGG